MQTDRSRESLQPALPGEVKPVSQTNGLGLLGDQMLTGFAWCEVFVGVGLHCFWILSKSSPLTVDDPWGALFALVPFAVMIGMGSAALNARMRRVLIRLEASFHWTACAVFTVLLVGAILHDPFNALIPLSLPMCLWSIGLSFALAADLSVHLRCPAMARTFTFTSSASKTILLAVVWWGGTMWLAAGATWVVYFWTASVVIHALLAPVSLRGPSSVPAPPAAWASLPDRLLTTVEALLLLSMLLLSQVRGIYTQTFMGTLESKYLMYLDTFRTPAFIAGVVLFLVAARLRLTLLTHAAIAGLLVFSSRENSWPVAMVFGYAFTALFRTTRGQGPQGYAVSCLIMSLIWLLGLSAFSFSGMVIHFKFGVTAVKVLSIFGHFCLFLFLTLCYLGVFLTGRKRTSGNGEPVPAPAPAPRMIACVLVFCAMACVIVFPGVALLALTAWPPSYLDRPARVPVETPMAVCHAGYSKSDEEYRILGDLGVQAVRADFHWHGIEPEAGKWDFSYRDAFVDAAVRNGTKVIAILDFDNDAVEQDPVGKTKGPYIAPADIPRFLEYVRQTVTHFKGRVYAWEIWNEPNIGLFWKGSLREFYVLARQTAEAVRAADPSAIIVGTAMTSPFGALTSEGIEGLHASGALAQVQYPSCHLYVTNPRHYVPEFMKVLATARRYRHRGSIWVTEVGAPDGGYYPWVTTGAMLADHVIKAYTSATSLGFDTVVWYCFRDASLDAQQRTPIDSERFFGLLGPGDVWKPSAYAYRLFSRYCSHSTIRSDLVHVAGGLAARQVRSALYRRDNGESALVLWFEPMLRPWGKARVHLEFGETAGPAMLHDIASDYSKALLADHVELTEKPIFLTFNAQDPEASIHIEAKSSAVDALWLLLVIGMTFGSLLECVVAFCKCR